MEKNSITLAQFETALLNIGVDIEEFKFKGKRPYLATGYVKEKGAKEDSKGKKYRWTADGKCFDMRSNPITELNVNIL